VLEPLLSINNFNKPATVGGDYAVVLLILRLIIMEPGSSIFQPEMGIGIKTRYRHVLEDQLSELDTEIKDQISKYLPVEAQTAEVYCSLQKDPKSSAKDKIFLLTIKYGDQIYPVNMNELSTVNDLQSISLSDLK
jgi:hypothetical protein